MNCNQISITGLLGKDPEAKQSGYISFYVSSLAHSVKKKNGTTETTWVDLVCFGDAAKMISGFRKGDVVYVHGRLSVKQDEKYKNVSILCDIVQQIPKKKDEGEQAVNTTTTSKPMNIDDIPF